MPEIYFIGGSPCSGKSTIAENIANKYGLHYFKVDDYLNKYISQGASSNYKICKELSKMNAEQIWMRDPSLQCQEELLIYEEIFDFVMQDLKSFCKENAVITEGAAYLPGLMYKMGIAKDSYLAITPTKEFQVSHYRQRDWIQYVLEGCSDREKAFDNWMERDALFADAVQKQCIESEYLSMINDGTVSIDAFTHRVSVHFGL